MGKEEIKPEILNKALNDKFPCSEAQLLALDQALADEQCRIYLRDNEHERAQLKSLYHRCIKQTAEELRQDSLYLYCKIADNEMGSTKDDDQLPESLKKLSMQFNKIVTLVIDEILKAPDANARTIIMERWAAIMQESLMLGDFPTASAISAAQHTACIKRLRIEPGLSQQAKEIIHLMHSEEQNSNILNNAETADVLMSHRSDLIIPHHGNYKSLLSLYKSKQRNLNQFEFAEKYKLLNDAIELYATNKSTRKNSYREIFTKYKEENREIKKHMLELAEKIRVLMEKQALGIDEKDDKSNLKKLENLYAAAVKAKMQSQVDIQRLWKEVLHQLPPKQQKIYEKSWRDIEHTFRDEHSRYQRVIADIISELNDRKQRLGGPIAFSELNTFQQEIALGMTVELFTKLGQSNFERSQHRLKKTEEAEVCDIFKDKAFKNIILADKCHACVKDSGTITTLKCEIKHLYTSLKEMVVAQKDKKFVALLHAITEQLDYRNTLDEHVAFLRKEMEALKKHEQMTPEILGILKKILEAHVKLAAIFQKISKDNPSVPLSASKVMQPKAPPVVIPSHADVPGHKQTYKERGSLIFGATFMHKNKSISSTAQIPQSAARSKSRK